MGTTYETKDISKLSTAEVQAEYRRVKELLKVANVYYPMRIKGNDGKSKDHEMHSLPQFLERFSASSLSVDGPPGTPKTAEIKGNYMDLVNKHYVTDRRERDGSLSEQDQRDFLEQLNKTVRRDPGNNIGASLGTAEEALKIAGAAKKTTAVEWKELPETIRATPLNPVLPKAKSTRIGRED